MDYLPIFINLKNRLVLVVGSGKIAIRKIKLLHKIGARVRLVAPDLGREMSSLLKIGTVEWINSNFVPNHLNDVFLVIAATNNDQLNSEIYKAANLRYKLVNVIDDPQKCSFIFPSIVNRSPIIVAISSNGNAPILSRLLREKIESLLPANFGKMAKIAGQWRDKVKQRYNNISERRRFWENAFNGLFASQMAAGNINEARCTLKRELNKLNNKKLGEIILVGAGPGDTGLLTLRGLQVMQSADVILYDHLINKEILELSRADAERIYVGKRAGLHFITQSYINNLLVTLAQQGKRVIRLKCGDPFIFGRGGEELQVAQEAGIPFQVVPGITSAIGATAYSGIPLTHRDYAQIVIFITGHCCTDNQNIDWSLLARSQQTLAIYMGTIKVREIISKLMKYGRHATTPVAVIGRGTLQDQQVLVGTLDKLSELVSIAPMPALLIIGEVVKLQKQLAWFQCSVQCKDYDFDTINLVEEKL